MPEDFYSRYMNIRHPSQKSNPSPSGTFFSTLLSVIRYISLFLIWLERWKRIKVIWRTTNIRFMFSSENSLFSKKVWKKLYCLRNTREHLHFAPVHWLCVWHCVMTPAGVAAEWDPSSLSVLSARMAGDGSASHGAAPDALEFTALGLASGAAWPPMQQGQLLCWGSRHMSWPCFWEETLGKEFFHFSTEEWRCQQSIEGLLTQLFIRHLSSLRSTTSIMGAFL